MNKKVYILTILVFVMAINAVFSQTTTKKLSYQAVVRNAANELVVNQNLAVEITILNAENAPQYKETHPSVPTNQNGLLWLWVGEGTPTLGTMANVVWKDATIKSVFTLPDGSTVEQNTPVTAMPYAYFADEVDTVFLQDYLTTHNYGNDDYVTHQELNDTLNHYYTNEQVDAALIPYATNAHLNDTLSHYLMKEVQVLSISHDTIFLTGGSFVVLPKGFSGSYHDLVDTPTNVSAFTNDAGYLTEHQSLEGYVTQDALNDTLSYYTTTGNIDTLLGAYFDSTQVKTAIHDTAEAIRAAIPASQVNADWNATSGPAEILNKPDLSVYATTNALKDSLTRYVDKDKLTDTLDSYYTKNNIDNKLNDYEKKSELCGDVKDCIKDTLDKYTTSDQIDTLLDAYATTEDLALYELQENLCKDVKTCIKDTLGKYTTSNQIDTLLRAYYDTTHTKSVISDTATALRAMMGDAAYNATITIKKNNVEVDHFTLNQEADKAINITVPTTVAELSDASNYVTKTKLNDTLGAYYDTANVYTKTKTNELLGGKADTANVYSKTKTNELLGGKADTANVYTKTKTNELLGGKADTANVYTKTKTNELLGGKVDTANVYTKTKTDELLGNKADTANVYTKEKTDKLLGGKADTAIVYTKTKTDELLGGKADTANVYTKEKTDKLLGGKADTANVYTKTKTNELLGGKADTANVYTKTKTNELLGGKADTANVYTKTKTNELLGGKADTANVYTRAKTNELLGGKADTANVYTRAKTNELLGGKADTANVYTKEKTDKLLGGKADTANVYTKTKTDELLNAKLNKAELCATIETSCTNVPLKSTENTFSGKNHFTDSVTVPSNNTIKRPTPATECTNLNAVNVCDLLAVFDSLTKRMNSLENELAAMKSAMKSTIVTLTIVDRTATSITVNADASNPALSISKYEFCCLNCGGGTTPVCTTSTSNQYTFDGLTPYTDYNFTVKAMTVADTAESSVSCKTKAEAPTAVMSTTVLAYPQAGFTVDLTSIDLKGVPNGTVKIEYKESSATDYGNEHVENITAPSSTCSKTFSDLNANTEYDVRIVVSNNDDSTTYTTTVTIGDAVTFVLTRVFPQNSSVKLCSGDTVYAFFSMAPDVGDVNSYTYQWSSTGENTSQVLSNSSLFLVEYITTGLKTISCIATDKTNTEISFQKSVTIEVVDNSNTDVDSGSEPYYDIDVNDHTVTLTDIGGSDMFVDWVSWQEGSEPEEAGNPISHTYDSYGTYTISAYSNDGCKKTSDVAVEMSVLLTNDHGSNNIGLCGEANVLVIYTAVPEGQGDYNYEWSVSGDASPSLTSDENTCEITYSTTGSYLVTCRVSGADITTPVEKTTTTNISAGTFPSFTFCENNHVVELKSVAHVVSPSYLDWGDGHIDPNPMYVPGYYVSTNTYVKDSTYTITLTNNYGCKTTKTVAIGNATMHPCTGTPHTGAGYTDNGFNYGSGNIADDGLEYGGVDSITAVTDYDGNIYPVVKIGSQCWLAENMRCTHSPFHDDGVSILYTGSGALDRKGSQVAQWYNNNSANASKGYGLLYNWCAAVDTFNATAGATIHNDAGVWWGCDFEGDRRGICPKGWHVPTTEEWTQMESVVNESPVVHTNNPNYVGTHAAKLSKSCEWTGSHSSSSYPNSYSDENRNASGFGATPAGCVGYKSGYAFLYEGTHACFWTATKHPTDNSHRHVRKLSKDEVGVQNDTLSQQTNQYSVRCVRDVEATPPAPTSSCGTMTDPSGNHYETIVIGEQCWTKTNLRTTKTRGGDVLNHGGPSNISQTSAFYYIPTLSDNWQDDYDVPYNSYNDSVFGYYYNWPAAAGEGGNSICPEGWHLPTPGDWNVLMTYLSSDANYYCDNNPLYIAKALSGSIFWKAYDEFCTPGGAQENNNSSGFSAIPSGSYNAYNGKYKYAGLSADFWGTTNEFDGEDYTGFFVRIINQNFDVDTGNYYADEGKSVRCVRDSE